jgi:hypothetical protein
MIEGISHDQFDGVSGIGVFRLNDLVLIDGLVSVSGLRVRA